MSVENSALDVERGAPMGAVFLSHAREDTEAARSIAQARRRRVGHENPEANPGMRAVRAGNAASAVPLLRQALHAGSRIAPLTVNQLKLDPWWDEIRGAPQFVELLANAPPLPRPVRE